MPLNWAFKTESSTDESTQKNIFIQVFNVVCSGINYAFELLKSSNDAIDIRTNAESVIKLAPIRDSANQQAWRSPVPNVTLYAAIDIAVARPGDKARLRSLVSFHETPNLHFPSRSYRYIFNKRRAFPFPSLP
jgi:hypothetical protein